MTKKSQNICADYALDDKYTKTSGQIFMTGTQALVRIPLLQAALDKKNGLNTAGFISGYRGSPLGNYDRELWRASKHLEASNVKFEPGINEELAATAVLGSQQVESSGSSNYDGVWGIWYGKGPGVDRAADALKHCNAFGASPHGGVLVIAGDDHAAVSSSMNHQSEQAMLHFHMPVLAPSTVSEYLEFGLYGFAMSRYSGCWSGFIAVSEILESAATITLENLHDDFNLPAHEGYDPSKLHYRWPDPMALTEGRTLEHKHKAVHAFVRANPHINKMIWDSPKNELGIITASKGHLDLMQALDNAGIDQNLGEELGISIYKIGLTYPIEPVGIKEFTKRFKRVIVIEEKKSFVEAQIRELLYNFPANERPVIIGKNDEFGKEIISPIGEFSPEDILKALTPYLKDIGLESDLNALNQKNDDKIKIISTFDQKDVRSPYFCSGCPHSTSTKVPEGSRAMAGIGCHFMAVKMDRSTDYLVQMGGEGVNWLGQSPFISEEHIFQNIGDGTYFHSGILAIRQAVAANVNITYKLLYNDAIAMTGGQPLEGTLTPPQISQQLHHEGVKPIYVITDEPEKYSDKTGAWANFAPGVSVHHRDELNDLQLKLREVKGVSALIYDQTCASEKRRRRKFGGFPDPAKRAFINELVCEGCGDCSDASNCLSILPVQTELGRKRAIDQSSCNKDYSCVNGFCPSFVTVHGGKLRKGSSITPDQYMADIPLPYLKEFTGSYDILVTGIGGTGVVTVGAILTMAAHLEGKGATVLDFTGFAQKGGSVMSYIRLAKSVDDLKTIRIGTGKANLLLGCDQVVAGSPEALRTLEKGISTVVLNTEKTQTAQFVLSRDADIHSSIITSNLKKMVGSDALFQIGASKIASTIMGNSIATNSFLMGFAWQKGQIPLSREAIYRAIELNNVAVDFNKQAFNWGRIAAHDPKILEEATPLSLQDDEVLTDLDDIINYRADFLTSYQDAKLADKYRSAVTKIRELEKNTDPSSEKLSLAVAKNYFKLLAIKDEFEVARLYTDGRFEKKLKIQFEGDYKLRFHMAPPLIARKNSKGELQKIEFGGWIFTMLKLTAKMRFLRGTWFDFMGRTDERKMERRLITDYEEMLETLQTTLNTHNLDKAADLANIPQDIRGYGHVKEKSIKQMTIKRQHIIDTLKSSQ